MSVRPELGVFFCPEAATWRGRRPPARGRPPMGGGRWVVQCLNGAPRARFLVPRGYFRCRKRLALRKSTRDAI